MSEAEKFLEENITSIETGVTHGSVYIFTKRQFYKILKAEKNMPTDEEIKNEQKGNE